MLLLCSFAVVSTQDFFLFFMFNYEIMAHLASKKISHSNANVNKVKLKKDLPVKLLAV